MTSVPTMAHMRIKLAALLTIATTAAMVQIATPAQAFIGLYQVNAVSPANANSPKNVSAACAPGDDIVSVMGQVNNGAGDVLLTRAYIDAAGGGTASGIEAIPTGVAWTVEVTLVCAPAGALVNRSMVQTVSASNMNDKFQTAACPAGDNIVGGGYFLTDAFGNVSIDEVTYNAAMTQLSVTAYDNAAVGNYTLTTQAVCADPLPISDYWNATSALNPTSPKSTNGAPCPIGSQVSAVGGVITGALGAASIATLTPLPVGGGIVAREVGPFAGNWSLQMQRICIG